MGINIDSPVSNNGRGLKLHRWRTISIRKSDSPVSNNGRGLKLELGDALNEAAEGFAR